jgi:hypothetical protein
VWAMEACLCSSVSSVTFGIAMATDRATELLEFESPQGQEFSFLHSVQTGSGAHPTIFAMGNGGFFLRE